MVGEEREQLGVMSLNEALQKADELDVDVVLISPDALPPVVRLVDYSKFRFEAAKAAKEASKKQRESRRAHDTLCHSLLGSALPCTACC